MAFLKTVAVVLLAAPLMIAAKLTPDGEKYLAEAKKRITNVEKNLATTKGDAKKSQDAVDALLASKRFLDNVQTEQPQHKDAAALQKKADVLLEQLKPTLLKEQIATRLGNIDEMIAMIEKDLAAKSRDAAADEKLRADFDLLRTMVRQVLDKDPANSRAQAQADKENALWQQYRQQREASLKGGTP